MHRILAIDPGSRVTGFAVVEYLPGRQLRPLDYGVLRIPAGVKFAEKLHRIRVKLQSIFVDQTPTDVVVEKIFLGRNVDSAFKLGHIRGVCLQLAVEAQSNLFEYAARTVKKAVTGHGGSSKEQVQVVAMNLLGLQGPTPLDASDSMALAICHARELDVKAKFAAHTIRGEI